MVDRSEDKSAWFNNALLSLLTDVPKWANNSHDQKLIWTGFSFAGARVTLVRAATKP